jgi:hypothetical protein
MAAPAARRLFVPGLRSRTGSPSSCSVLLGLQGDDPSTHSNECRGYDGAPDVSIGRGPGQATQGCPSSGSDRHGQAMLEARTAPR